MNQLVKIKYYNKKQKSKNLKVKANLIRDLHNDNFLSLKNYQTKMNNYRILYCVRLN